MWKTRAKRIAQWIAAIWFLGAIIAGITQNTWLLYLVAAPLVLALGLGMLALVGMAAHFVAEAINMVLLLQSGQNPVVISKRLGHSTASMTLDTLMDT